MIYVRTSKNKTAIYGCVSNCFCFVLRAGLAGRSAQSCEKLLSFIVFSGLGHFSQVFRQVKGWFILELSEMIRVSHVVLGSIIFILLYYQGWQGRMFNVMEMIIFSDFGRLGPFR